MRQSRRVPCALAFATAFVYAPIAHAHNEGYLRARGSGTLWAELSIAAVYHLAPIATPSGPSLQAATVDIVGSFPWIPIELRLRAGADWRTDGLRQWTGPQLGLGLGVNGGALLSMLANASWVTDPYFSPLNPTAGFAVDWYDVNAGDLVSFGAYVSNTMYFGCYVGVRMTAEFPFTTGPGLATTLGISLVIATRTIWDDAPVECGEWRRYLERSAHPAG